MPRQAPHTAFPVLEGVSLLAGAPHATRPGIIPEHCRSLRDWPISTSCTPRPGSCLGPGSSDASSRARNTVRLGSISLHQDRSSRRTGGRVTRPGTPASRRSPCRWSRTWSWWCVGRRAGAAGRSCPWWGSGRYDCRGWGAACRSRAPTGTGGGRTRASRSWSRNWGLGAAKPRTWVPRPRIRCS